MDDPNTEVLGPEEGTIMQPGTQKNTQESKRIIKTTKTKLESQKYLKDPATNGPLFCI